MWHLVGDEQQQPSLEKYRRLCTSTIIIHCPSLLRCQICLSLPPRTSTEAKLWFLSRECKLPCSAQYFYLALTCYILLSSFCHDMIPSHDFVFGQIHFWQSCLGMTNTICLWSSVVTIFSPMVCCFCFSSVMLNGWDALIIRIGWSCRCFIWPARTFEW